MAYDPVHEEIFVANHGTPSSLYVYARTASGKAAPLRILAGLATGIHQPFQILVDPVNDELYVTNRLDPVSVRVFARSAGGNALPLRVIAGSNTNLGFPQGIAIDLDRDEIFIADGGVGNGRILVFPRAATGNQAPVRTIQGPNTGLSLPRGLAVDPATAELFVTNQGGFGGTASIGVFPRTADGNATPIRSILGPDSGIDSPSQIVILPGPPPPPPDPTTLVAAVLPNARAVQVGTPVTVNATVINAGGAPAIQVGISLASLVPASFGYWLLDTSVTPVQLVGAPNTPVDIPACIPPASCPHKDFLIFMTPTGAFGPTELFFTFAGSNTPPVAALVGINTLLLLASATPTPDMVALAGTAPNDGIARIPGVTGTGFFVVATTNLGIGDLITVSADSGAAVVPVDVQICETNPGTGACLAPPTPTVTTFVAAGAQPTFAFFVRGLGVAIPLDPAVNRAFARFRRADSLIVGGTSVAVITQ